MKQQIKTIIFDFGDVLVSDTMNALEEKYGFNKMSSANKQRYMHAIYQSEVGKMPTSAMLRVVHETLVSDMTPRQIGSSFVHNKVFPTWKLAERLSRKYKILILSNNQKSFPRLTSEALGINFLKFPFINSARVGLRKPHKGIYTYTLEKYKLKPRETIFIDDKAINLVPAKKLGIHTFQYKKNYRELVTFLKKLGVKV